MQCWVVTMVTTSWVIVCVDVVKKWWEMMSSLESDLKELRSMQLTTSSLSEDSRSIRYDSNQSLATSTNNSPRPGYTSPADKSFTLTTNKSGNTFQKGVYVRGTSKKAEVRRRRAYRESSRFNYIAPERYPKYPHGVYRTWKAGLGLYDLLALVHLVPAPWDHPFKPPFYPPLPLATVLQYAVIELE